MGKKSGLLCLRKSLPNVKRALWAVYTTALFQSQLTAQPTDHEYPLQGYPQVNLYVSSDRKTYLPGENVWFTGYVMNRDKALKAEQNTLYAVLVDPIDRKVISKGRFAILYGIGKGNLSIPDTLAPGPYWLAAFTNASLEHPNQPVFRKLLTIRNGAKDPFRVKTSIISAVGDDTLRIKYRVSTAYNGLASGAEFDFTVYDDDKPLVTSSQSLDPNGEITVALPRKSVQFQNTQTAVYIRRGKDSQKFILPFPTAGPTGAGNHFIPVDDEAFSSHLCGGITPVAAIALDSSLPGQHQSVSLRIHFQDSTGKTIAGIFSLSVAYAKFSDAEGAPTILNYTNKADSIFPGDSIGSIPYRRAVRQEDRMPDSGYVSLDGQYPNRKITLLYWGTGFTQILTDSMGRFHIPYELLVARPGVVPYLSVAEQNVDRYKIVVNSKAIDLLQRIATTYHPVDTFIIVPDGIDSSISFSGPGLLQAATVKAKKIGDYNYMTGEYNSTHCETDFVCTHDHGKFAPQILNCPEYQLDTCKIEKPVEGREYLFLRDSDRIREFYHSRMTCPVYRVKYHCSVPYLPPFVKALDPILLEKQFPRRDSSDHRFEFDMQPTLLWEPALIATKGKDVETHFYTNALTGKFICKIEGLTTAGAVHTRLIFSVNSTP